MRCISKKLAFLLIGSLLVFSLSACGVKENISYEKELNTTAQAAALGLGFADTESGDAHTVTGFAEELVATPDISVLNENVEEDLSVSALLFCLDDQEVLYQKNIFRKLNPASTTKILTAYTALKHADLNLTVTVSENALNLIPGSSVAGFSVGDTIPLKDALYGLMLPSGNDAATAIAESVSGSVAAFTDLMNEEAKAMGATSTHYVNAHGLSTDQHYTTVYDLYLMLNTALKNDTFYQVLTTPTYSCEYHDADGNVKTSNWKTTNYYLLGKAEAPEGVTVLGGKTGTTEEAGSCLVMLSEYQGKSYVSIVLGAPSKDILYKQMTQLLYLIVA